MTLDLQNAYLIAAYCAMLVACAVATFSKSYGANTAQRAALLVFSIYAGGSALEIFRDGHHAPYEIVGVSAILVYVVGSAWKTIKYAVKNSRRDRRSSDQLSEFPKTEFLNDDIWHRDVW
jgi:hypothetical protein